LRSQNYIVGKPSSLYAQAVRLAPDTAQPSDYVGSTAVFRAVTSADRNDFVCAATGFGMIESAETGKVVKF